MITTFSKSSIYEEKKSLYEIYLGSSVNDVSVIKIDLNVHV